MAPLYNFDGSFTISISDPDRTSEEECPILGNGKICLIPKMDGSTISKSFITADSTSLIQLFNTFTTVFEISPTDPITTLQLALDMSIGMFKSQSASQSLYFEHDMYVPRHLPFCTIKTIRLTPSINFDNLEWRHEVSRQGDLNQPKFNNNMFYDNGLSIYALSCESNQTNQTIASTSTYIFEGCDYVSLGYNVFENTAVAYNKFSLKNLVAGTTYKIHIITAQMSSYDFDDPVEECKRIILNCARLGISRIRTGHVQKWQELWNTDITIVPKVGISSGEEDAIKEYNRALRTALYTIYSCTRETYGSPSVGNLGILDLTSAIADVGDLYFLPTLLMLRPKLAKPYIEWRYKQLDIAKQLAAGMGFAGSKFPYKNDLVGYKNNMYWNTYNNNMTVYNNALISINVWNYFRATKDRDWLSTVGFPILKGNAEFFASIVTGSRLSNEGLSISDIIGLSGEHYSTNNTMTNGLVMLATKYAMEAAYELTNPVPASWIEIANWLPLLQYSGANKNIYKFDSTINILEGDAVAIAEPLFILLPYYFNKKINAFQNRSVTYTDIDINTLIKDNITAYSSSVVNENNILNVSVAATLQGVYAQFDQSYVPAFISKWDQLIQGQCNSGIWRQIKANDINVASMILFTFLQGLGQVNITGGIAETRFYYEELNVTASQSANMPATWKNIRLMGVGQDKLPFIVQNVIYYC